MSSIMVGNDLTVTHAGSLAVTIQGEGSATIDCPGGQSLKAYVQEAAVRLIGEESAGNSGWRLVYFDPSSKQLVVQRV